MNTGIVYRPKRGKAHRPTTISLLTLSLACDRRDRGVGDWWHGPITDVDESRLCRHCFPPPAKGAR